MRSFTVNFIDFNSGHIFETYADFDRYNFLRVVNLTSSNGLYDKFISPDYSKIHLF